MTSTTDISALFHSLGQQATLTDDDTTITASFNVGPDVDEVTFDKDKTYNQHDVLTAIARAVDKHDPHNDPVGPEAGNPKKDKLRAQGVPQPGAEVPKDGGPAKETPANEDKTGTPAAGL